jgi:hypothetical protein
LRCQSGELGGIQLEGVAGEALEIPFQLLIETERLDAKQPREISVQNDTLPANLVGGEVRTHRRRRDDRWGDHDFIRHGSGIGEKHTVAEGVASPLPSTGSIAGRQPISGHGHRDG